MRTVEQIRQGLADILASEPESLLLGEDILDPYGGAFKVTQGLSTRFPGQVLQTPISEAGFVGVAAGLAYVGYRPIVEIMFGDFVPLIADAVLNTASKLPWLSRGRMAGDLLIRAPMGGRRGYGPIHSQSLEKLYFGWPEVALFAPNLVSSPYELLLAAFRHPSKVKLFVENKTDYVDAPWTVEDLARRGFALEARGDGVPVTVVSNSEGEDPDVAICCYGGMVRHALDAAYELLVEDEITSAVLVPSLICPLDVAPLAGEIRRAERLVIAEEGYASAGWGSYLLGELAASGGCDLPLSAVRLIGPELTPIPASIEREREHLPQADDIIRAVRELR